MQFQIRLFRGNLNVAVVVVLFAALVLGGQWLREAGVELGIGFRMVVITWFACVLAVLLVGLSRNQRH